MKILLALLLSFASLSAMAQTVTNFQFRTIVIFTGGASVTNNITVPTNQFLGIQFAVDKLNNERTNAVPPLPRLTNFAHYAIEVLKTTVKNATNEYDLDLPKTLQERVGVMSENDKNTIRNILLTY